MERTVNHRRVRGAVVAAVAAAAGLLAAVPAEAQQRLRVLVPEFEATEQVRGNFGRDVAQRVQRAIDQMATHQPVQRNDLRDQLRRFDLNERDLTCIPAMQLATRAGWELVMCGQFQPDASGGMSVEARVVSPETQEEFEIPRFVAANANEAGDHIVGAFQNYIEYLSAGRICQEEVENENWEEALTRCDRALALNPRGQTPLYARAYALMNLERNEEAMQGFQTMLEHYPMHQETMLAAGIVATRLGQSDVAMGYFNQYLEMDPGNVQVRMTVANDIFQAGDPAAALLIMEEGIRSQDDPDIAMYEYAGHFAVAAAQQRQEASPANGNDAEARRFFQQALEYFNRVYQDRGAETDAAVLRQMAAVYLGLDQNQEALEFVRRATQSHPDDATLWARLATAYDRTGDRQEALAALDRVEQLDPEYRSLYAMRGEYLLQAGNLERAVAAFRRAVERGEINNPDQQLAQRIAAMGFQQRAQRGQHQEAIQWYEAARQFAQSDLSRAMANFFHGYALIQINQARQEPQTCQSARQTLPEFQRARQLLQNAAAYQQQDQARRGLIENANQFIEIQEAILAQARCRG
jgi:tetratricopeptide (TPR) repeat protein